MSADGKARALLGAAKKHGTVEAPRFEYGCIVATAGVD